MSILKLNLITQSKCLTCDNKITEQDIKKFATNFLLLEIIEKSQKSTHSLDDNLDREEKVGSKKKSKKSENLSKNANDVTQENVTDFYKIEELAFICIQCNVAITNKNFHLSKFPLHTFSNYKNILDERVQKIKEKQKHIIDEYYSFNKSFNDTHNAFVDFVVKNFYW